MALPQGPYLLPHPLYAEEQPYARSILTTHVLYRGFQAGALVGTLGAGTRMLFRPSAAAPAAAPISKHPVETAHPGRLLTVFRASGRGGLIGMVLLSVALPIRMWDRQPIEWQDRAWRLLENRGQVSTDRWSGAGALIGGLLAVTGGMGGTLAIAGAAGLGSLAGCMGSIGFRLGRKEFD